MKLIFLNVQSTTEKWSELAEKLYLEKIQHFHKTEMKSLKPGKKDRSLAELKKKQDTELILSQIDSTDYVILFDENGSAMDSIAYSQALQRAFNSGKKRLVFVIGGAFGVTPDLTARANLKISFSKMTMNHLLAQVVCLEQTYRALTIIHHLPYHNI